MSHSPRLSHRPLAHATMVTQETNLFGELDSDSYSFRSSTVDRTSVHSDVTTSPSTIWGPGALAGKALLAFGNATLKGVENVIVSQRLRAIRTFLSNENNRRLTETEKSEKVFDDLIELSR
jgi:hypothetical protein